MSEPEHSETQTAKSHAKYGATSGFKKDPNQGRGTRSHGAFVYTGSGKKLPKEADVALKDCKKFALDLQYCLSRRGYKEKYCTDFIKALEECRSAAYARESGK